MKRGLLCFFLLLFCGFLMAQDCEDGILNNNELRIDCGGPDCPRCIPFLYEVYCDEYAFFTFFFTLPDYWWLEEFDDFNYSLSGDFNIDSCFVLNDCSGFIEYNTGTEINIRIELENTEGEVLGIGNINSPHCMLFYDYTYPFLPSLECPDTTNFVVEATYVDNGDDFSYMVRLEMSGGLPPYAVKQDSSDYFYELDGESDTIYIGAFPNDYDISVTVFDANGCSSASITTPMLPDTTDMTGLAILEDAVLEGCNGLIREASLFPTVHQSAAQLSLNLREAGEVSLAVYDLLGTYVGALLEDHLLPVGASVVSLETGDLERGVYIYQLRSCEGTRSFKVIRD